MPRLLLVLLGTRSRSAKYIYTIFKSVQYACYSHNSRLLYFEKRSGASKYLHCACAVCRNRNLITLLAEKSFS
ncbi:hypothetical protein BGX38DRAFT_586384 [Terfezia claveryi]|nr:hypothetical protein BGX38DRAFT_586384 [Terfezia claveryi]